MKENPDIEELLNSFIDGELTERQQTEVHRLIARDARVAQRLRELQKCKMLVGSLPCVEAPAGMAEEIKASLETKPLPAQPVQWLGERAGARHLLVRKILAAAAMIGLAAVLAALVYTIVAPEGGPESQMANRESQRRQPLIQSGVSDLRQAIGDKRFAGFYGRLELKTGALAEVNSFINRAIEDNGLLAYGGPGHQEDKTIYSLSCSQESLNLLLADLKNIWEKFDSATLFVETETIGEQVVVEAVTTERIAEIVADLITPPKPRLTRSEEAIKKPAARVEDGEKVSLTIVIAGSQ